MATNNPAGDGHRIGAVRDRSQVFNPVTEQYVKRNTTNGQFMDVKQDGTPFKGVRKEKGGK
ncbi:hypothetical protein GO988_22495 [Hymenobacter sp. HMF4947]|uniref:Uncharacterized protein n=1 Tax=Hymenobacter ginkgonis TaxID=2682976 RepID=A0A7K1TL26_9BACT|nr:hypothetical protein [Hymenobacter ginkgonis]MVN79110.1 hypothetical protein [Hymenobacter ginkgonis]